MTEEESRKKWCPMVRFHNGLDGDVYCSRPVGIVDDNASKCIASDCAMWVWDYPDGAEMLSEAHKELFSKGHCGLIKG